MVMACASVAASAAGQEQYDRYTELKALHAKYVDDFTVLPSMPVAHYITHTLPRIKADWVHDGEINYQTGVAETILMLDGSPNYVLALKDEMHRIDEQGTFRCSVLKHVTENWVLIDSTQEFWVYGNALTTISAVH